MFNEEANSVSAWKSASLYIGDLSTQATEKDLVEIFSVFGPLHSVKVCRNWDTGEPLGYGFLNYENEVNAEAALSSYNFKPVCGKPCRLMWSTKRSASCLKEEHAANIFVKGLPKTVDNKLLFDTFSKCGTVLSSRVARNKKGASLGYGYVSFTSYAAAEKAIASLNGVILHGQSIGVEPFVDKAFREERPWSNVHILGIPPHWTREILVARFSCYGEIRSAVIMTNEHGVSKGFGFVDFVQHSSAVLAVEDNQSFTPSLRLDYSPFEEKQESRFSMFTEQISSVPLKVTPALKKTEKSNTSFKTKSSICNSPILSPLTPEFSGLNDYRGDFLLRNDLNDILGTPRKLRRSPQSVSTASTGFLSGDEQLFPELTSLTQGFNDFNLNLNMYSSPPGF